MRLYSHHQETTAMASVPPIDTLLSHFTRTLSMHVRPTWLSLTLSSQRQIPPGPALYASLKFRILASDITESLQPHANLCFPPTAHDADAASTTLPGPVAVQVVSIEDIGVSKVEQIDRLEMVERGEVMRGREVVRVVPDGDGEGTQGRGSGGEGRKSGPCKLLLEDAGGRRVYGIEMKSVEGVKNDMAIGAKLVLKNVVVARGLLLLTPANTTFLGGKIEAMNQAWLASRKQTLQASVDQLKARN